MSTSIATGNGHVTSKINDSEDQLHLEALNTKDELLERQEENITKNPDTELTWRDTIPQLYTSLCAHSIVIHAGINMAFSSVLLPDLSKDDSDIPITKEEASWIASTVALSTPIGALAAGPLMDWLGRRNTARIACFPLMLAWIMMALSSSVTFLCIGRLIAGVGGGLTTVALVYVTECSHPRLRPALLCLNSVAVSLGVLGTYVAFVVLPSWRWFSWCCALLALISLILLIAPKGFSPPESPHWLYLFPPPPKFLTKFWMSSISCMKRQVSENTSLNNELRRKNAVSALRRLNPSDVHFTETLKRLQILAQERSKSERFRENWGLKEIFTRPSARRPLFLLFILFLFQQLSGTYVIVFYAVDVLRGLAGKVSKDEDIEAIALISLGGIRLIASIVTAVLSRHIGRKYLCGASGIGMAIAALASGLFEVNTEDSGTSALIAPTWLMSIFVLIHVCAAALGILVIPWTLIGELLPDGARAIGGGISVCIAYGFMFAAVKGFHEAQNAIGGTQPLFLFFAFASLAGVIFLALCIPETFGRSLQEIEHHFKGGKNAWWWGWKVWTKRNKEEPKIIETNNIT